MITPNNKLIVKYNNKIVGYLAELKNQKIAFQYNDDWLKKGFSISPFSLPLKPDVFVCNTTTFDGIFGVFWNSLPDGWGELVIKRMLSKQGINYDKLSPIAKLSIVGKNGLGALEYEPVNEITSINPNYNLDFLAMEAKKLLETPNAEIDLERLYQVGGSSGGARPKAHLCINDEEWIVKFPCRIDPPNVGKAEFEANSLAKQCNINVSPYKLFDSKLCSGYFGTKRFDRLDNGEKRHVISLSALLETTHRIPNLDYSHLFQVIECICPNKQDLYEAFKQMCFNTLYQNKDDHGKNFSFVYDEQLYGYTLSPAYDLTHLPDKAEHEMTVNGNGNPTEKDLLAVAKRFNLSIEKCKNIINFQRTILAQNLH